MPLSDETKRLLSDVAALPWPQWGEVPITELRRYESLELRFIETATPVHGVSHELTVSGIGAVPMRLYRPGWSRTAPRGALPARRRLGSRRHRALRQLRTTDLPQHRPCGPVRRIPPRARTPLIYPPLDPACATDSYRAYGTGYLLDADTMRQAWALYLAGADSSPESSPALAPLPGLPPALVITAEYDVLRDEDEVYAARLSASGVSAVVERFDGTVHGFWAYGRVLTAAAAGDAAIARFLADTSAPRPPEQTHA